jgi:CubicO group peptidase (beta-lactamase class C family)
MFTAMPRLRLLPALFVLPLAAVATGSSQDLRSLIRDTVAQPLAEEKLVGAVTLVARDGAVLDLQAHGWADREAQRPMTPDTIFRIHSCTKGITSAAVLMLHEEGKFQFEDPVSRWLPEFAGIRTAAGPAGRPVTVGHLLTHTSGLTYDHRAALDAGNSAAVAAAIAATPLAFDPGSGWAYGVSIDVLGRLVEIWSDRSFESFLSDRIFGPLGMVDTAFHVPEEKRDRLATLYRDDKGTSGKLVASDAAGLNEKPVPAQTPEFCMPGGGLYSTARDYHRFLQMIQNGGELEGKRLLQTRTVSLMQSNQVPGGIGWIRFGREIRDGFGFGYGFNAVCQPSQWDPEARVGESGWGGAASCHYWMHPDHRLIVITLEQTMPYRWTLERALKGRIYKHFAVPSP